MPWRSPKQPPSQKPEIILRPAAGGADTLFVGRLSGKVFNIYGPYQEIIPKWIESGIGLTIIALMDGRPMGFAMIGEPYERYDLQPSSELLAIAVDPERKGMGVGKLLLKEIERRAVEMKVKRIFLHTAVYNLSAQRLFSRVGYGIWEIKKCFYPEGQDALVMFKVLFENN
jgi:ribosomal protein S18 acetylase RimI-like enzyme